MDTDLSRDFAETTANITHVNVNSIEESISECSNVDGTAQYHSDNAVDTDMSQYLPHRHCAEPNTDINNGQYLRTEYSSTERAAQSLSNNAVDTDIGRDLAEPTANITKWQDSDTKFTDGSASSFGLNSQKSSISGSVIPNNCQNSTVEDDSEQKVSKFDNLKQSDTSSDIVLEPNKYNQSHLEDDFNTDHVEAEKDDLNIDRIIVEKHKCFAISARNKERYSKWLHWCEKVSPVIQQLLREVHGGVWQTRILHVEHVKSYAPHVDHIVLDLKCLPVIEDNLTDIKL